MNILLVEDHADLAIEIIDYLQLSGHRVDRAADGLLALQLASTERFDAIILDLGLPDMDGLEVCRLIRERPGKTVPILMLTARDTLQDRLRGFEQGADDYLIKPFSLKELLARLKALVRLAQSAQQQSELHVGDLSFNVDTLTVQRGGRLIALQPARLLLLEILMRASPSVVRKAQLEQAIWGDNPPDSDALSVHIHHLRAALNADFSEPILHTVHGIGYQLKPAADRSDEPFPETGQT